MYFISFLSEVLFLFPGTHMSQYGGEMETDNAALSKVEAEAPAEEKYPRNKRECEY